MNIFKRKKKTISPTRKFWEPILDAKFEPQIIKCPCGNIITNKIPCSTIICDRCGRIHDAENQYSHYQND
jgi:hypothetical protein